MLSRAGFGVVQADDEGNFHRAVYGLIPRLVGQTSFAGENGAICVAFDLATSPLKLWSDCLGAIKYYERGLVWACDVDRCAGSIWRSISQRHPDLSNVCQGIGHVKAHRDDSEACDDAEIVRIKGNRLADEFAKRGASLHLPDEGSILSHRLLRQRIKIVLGHISACLSLWPAPCIEHKPARRKRGRFVKRPIGHFPSDLTWSFNRWHCSVCCGSFATLPRHQCPGESRVFKEVLSKHRGHRLWSASVNDGTTLLYCRLCGCSSSSKGAGLLKDCQGCAQGKYDTATGLKRLQKGRHPWKPVRISKPWPVQLQIPTPAPCAPLSASGASMPICSPAQGLGQPHEVVHVDAGMWTAAGDSEPDSDDAL